METSQTWMANVEIINASLAKESWYNTFWAKFSGNVDLSNDENGNTVYSPSGQPINIMNQFIQQGRDNMLIPFLSDLTGSPVYGDTVLKGTGEDQSMKWLRTFVNQYRKAVMKKSGSMSEQRQKIYKLYEAAKPQLSRWFAKWENQAIFQTFYEGVSPNLSTGTNSDGLGIVKRYHPNWWANVGGVLTSVGTSGTTKTNAQLDAVIGKTAADDATCDTGMTAAILHALRVKCMELRIPQMTTKQGHPFWCIVMHPASASALMQDSTYKSAVQAAYTGKMLDEPELIGAIGYFAGFAIYEDIVGIREWDEAGYFFGASTSARLDPTAVTLAAGADRIYNHVVFGKNAIGKGVARDLHFTNEVDDHENTIEIGGAVINGYQRNEYFAESDATLGNGDAFERNNATAVEADAGFAAENTSSLIFTTEDD
jgi:hypothetical protein